MTADDATTDNDNFSFARRICLTDQSLNCDRRTNNDGEITPNCSFRHIAVGME